MARLPFEEEEHQSNFIDDKKRPRDWPSSRWINLTMFVISGVALSSLLSDQWTDHSSSLFDWVSSIIVASITAFLVGALLIVYLIDSRKLRKSGRGEPTISDRIEQAASSMRTVAKLVNELEAEMQLRSATLERLHAENDQYEKLAALRKEEAEAVSRLMESVISSTHSKLAKSNRRDQILFFALGILASVVLQFAAGWISLLVK